MLQPESTKLESRWKVWGFGFALATALIFATRWPLVPKKHLFHIDNVNFALALDRFNPRLHQPQPPGDPMYVALTKLLRFAIPRPEILFPVSGIIGSVLALMVLWRLGSLLFGERAGFAAALLLAVNPIFWLAGVGNYVRVYLALGAAAVAYLIWKSLTAEGSSQRRYVRLAAISLGFFSGFRPEMAPLLLPLLAYGVSKIRARAKEICTTAALWIASTLPWLIVTAAKSGGFVALYRLNSRYLAQQSSHFSWFYGATPLEAARMAASSVYWTGLGALSWIALVPRAKPWQSAKALLPQWRFLSIWFVPAFLFHTFIHIHNPDHALIEIPVVCLVGGFVLSRLTRFVLALGAAVALNVILFFYPSSSPFWASNYRIAEYVMRTNDAAYDGLAELRREGPVVVLWRDGVTTPQEISYYFPDIPVIILPANGPPSLRIRNRSFPLRPAAETREMDAEVAIPPGTIVWMESAPHTVAHLFDALSATREIGPLHCFRAERGQHFTLGATHFVIAGVNLP